MTEFLLGVIAALVAAVGFLYTKNKISLKSKMEISSKIKGFIDGKTNKAGSESLADTLVKFNRSKKSKRD